MAFPETTILILPSQILRPLLRSKLKMQVLLFIQLASLMEPMLTKCTEAVHNLSILRVEQLVRIGAIMKVAAIM